MVTRVRPQRRGVGRRRNGGRRGFRRHRDREAQRGHDERLTDRTGETTEIGVNRYFTTHPEHLQASSQRQRSEQGEAGDMTRRNRKDGDGHGDAGGSGSGR